LTYNDVFREGALDETATAAKGTKAAQAIKNSKMITIASIPVPPVVNGPYDVYKPTQSDWGIQDWKSDYPFKAGDLLLEESGEDVRILEMNANVKGNWQGNAASAGDFYFDDSDKKWYKADVDITSADKATAPSASSSKWSVVESSPEKTVAEILGADRTSDFADPVDSQYWTKTHFGNLLTDSETTGTETIGVDYQRGDNILYKGKHYVYVSPLSSNDPEFAGAFGPEFTEFEDLLTSGAVREASLYVDTKGGGGSPDLPAGVFYRPNEELEHMDRLPDSGLARANSITRRTNSSSPPGDDIFNSADDMFHGGLDAGSDGIYGTADDFYASTTLESNARKGFHVDADADNNKDLLNAKHDLSDFSVADFVDYIQSLANFRAINGGTMSRLSYSTQMLDENEINLEAAVSRIMDADMALEASKLARQNVLVQAGASMLVQSNQLSNVVLSLLQ
jgi:flagellin-like hook-associated protein FlgL